MSRIEKKVKVEMPVSILEKLTCFKHKTESIIFILAFKHLFHTGEDDYKNEDNKNMFFRNVRNGLR